MVRNKLPNQTSIELGLLLREARKKGRITLKELGVMLGLSFQQLQKYEAGANELSTDWQRKVIKHLKLPHDYFQLGKHNHDFYYPLATSHVKPLHGLSDKASENNTENSNDIILEIIQTYSVLNDEERASLIEYLRYLKNKHQNRA